MTENPRSSSNLNSPHQRPVLIYAAQCPFCCRCASLVELLDKDQSLAFVALDDPVADILLPNLTLFERVEHWHLVDADGADLIEGDAILRLLEILNWTRWMARIVRTFRLKGALTEIDRFLARHRRSLGRLAQSCDPPLRYP